MITREDFIAATGREPMLDDLERCNCQLADQPGHWYCGWDSEHNRPRFEYLALFAARLRGDQPARGEPPLIMTQKQLNQDHLRPRCHPKAAVGLCYHQRDGTLTIVCHQCNAPVVTILVAPH
jgi:hypothetical protein